MTSKRAYWGIPIQDNQEPLLEIPVQDFAAAVIHDYQKLGAPYGGTSPYAVRETVLRSLYQAQSCLQAQYPQWRLYIFDAYRPLAVQQFMADYAYDCLLQDRQLDAKQLKADQQEALWQEVYKIWAPPNENPLTPPPHSTGAAVDLTLFDLESQTCVEMGSPIDEMSERSQPLYFDHLIEQNPLDPPALEQAKIAAKNRQILADVMIEAGFKRHPGEWWHFCLGDQMWAWLNQAESSQTFQACYGRYDLLGQAMVSQG